jgi:hypothetical protein
VAEEKVSNLKSMTNIEHLEKRVGIIAVEKGFITADQLVEGLKIQVEEDLETGRHRLIGRILVEQKRITQLQLDEVLMSLREKARANPPLA